MVYFLGSFSKDLIALHTSYQMNFGFSLLNIGPFYLSYILLQWSCIQQQLRMKGVYITHRPQ